MKRNSTIYKLVSLTIAITCMVTLANAQDAENTCQQCHNDLVALKIVHAPATESCESCHTANENEHPQEGVKGFQLADEATALCFYCHEEFSETNIHAPAESGECVMCHNPHSSNYPSLLTASSEKALCLQCHEMEIPNTDVVHSPVEKGKCSECHDPHQSNESAFLKTSKPDLCYTCHKQIKELASASNKHAVFEDDCFNCHQPHSASAKSLLMEPMPTLCYNCHSDVQEQVGIATVVHKVMSDEKSCSNCHSPHASNNTAMLYEPTNDLCLSCHNRTYSNDEGKIENISNKLSEGNSIHAPVEDACVNCHLPHASEYSSLLTNKFPKGTYAAASIDNYELCFNCHDSELLTAEINSTTNFRHGEKNMHFLHLKGDKGKSCTMCHDVHGAKNEHLISKKVPFGSWQMDLNYKVTENGGSCATGCHAEKEYDRSFVITEEKIASAENQQNPGNRYQNFEMEYYKVDSSVVLANQAVEQKRQGVSDTTQEVLIAQQIQDTLQSLPNDTVDLETTESLIAETDSLSETDAIAEQTVQRDTVPLAEESEEVLVAENNSIAQDSVVEVKDIAESAGAIDTGLIASNEAVKEVVPNETQEQSPNETHENKTLAAETAEEMKSESLEMTQEAEIALSESAHPIEGEVNEQNTDKILTPEFNFSPVEFAFDSKSLGKEIEKIKKVIVWMQKNKSMSIELHGFTDNIGPEEYNNYLSLLRAKSVSDFMVGEGIKSSRLKVKGFGEKSPIAPNSSREGRARNRRVEFILIEED